jgi:hypothetical protein
LHPDGPLVGFHDLVADVQAQASASAGANGSPPVSIS